MSSRARIRRRSATETLRKVRRGIDFARRRHMTIRDVVCGGLSSTDHVGDSMMSLPAMTNQNEDNPYDLDSRRVRETIEAATSIVHNVGLVCTSGSEVLLNDELLERLCLLVTPDDDPIATCTSANSILTRSVQRQQCEGESPAVNLACALVEALSKIIVDDRCSRTVRIKSVIIVNQLAAMEPPLLTNYENGEVFSPRSSSIPASWCATLVGSSALLSALLQLLSTNLLPTDCNLQGLELCEKSAWALGNLAGSSETARTSLLDANILPRLTGCISLGTSMIRRQNNGDLDLRPTTTSLLRSAIWAMTNVICGGRIVMSASTITDLTTVCSFRHDDGTLRVWAMQNIPLPRVDVSMLLSCSCNDVVNETCWLILSLTRDGSMVEYYSDDGALIRPLVERLARATDVACRRLVGNIAAGSVDIMHGNGNDDDDSVQTSGCLVPLCRIIKNAANAFYDDGYTLKIDSIDQCRSVGSSLARLISLGTLGAGGEANTVAYEAASTVGACLNHVCIHDTSHLFLLACETTLRSALCGALVNELSTFDLRREVVWALWNMVNSHKKDELCCNEQIDRLVGIMSGSPHDVARSLTSLLSTMDSDAIEASLCLIDVVLRRVPGHDDGSGTMPTIFEEVGLVDALWRVCDCDLEKSFIAKKAAIR